MTTSAKYMAIFALLTLVLVPLVSAAQVDVTITVIDKEGDEIKDAVVSLEYKNGTEICTDEETDKKGEVDCNNIESGEDVKLFVSHDDYQDIDDADTLYDYDKDWENIAVVMRPKDKFTLTVTVVDQDDDNVKDATVTVKSLDNDLDEDDFDSDFDTVVFPDEKSKYEAFEYTEDGDTDKNGEIDFDDLEFNTQYKITVEKSGSLDTSEEFDFTNDPEDDEEEIQLQEPGTAQFTAIVRDQDSNAFVEGATVIIASRDTSFEDSKDTNSNGEAKFTLDTPQSYDVVVEAPGYSSDSMTDMQLDNDDVLTSPFYIISQNNAPVANAGDDFFIIVGDSATLDASGSTDKDDDDLTYTWEDSLGTTIPDGVSPTVLFDVAGEHAITLTVDDGTETAQDVVKVVVGSPADCGDALCTIAERETLSCPTDCPVCGDSVCGAGETVSDSELYCPRDCDIGLKIELTNNTKLVAGNTTTILVVDPNTGEPVLGVNLTITQPNGSVLLIKPVMGRAEFTFKAAGDYEIKLASPGYVDSKATITVNSSGMDMGWVMWVVIAIVAIVLVLFLVRFMNMRGGGVGGRGKGYRAKKYRRGKPTLSSI